MKNIKVHLQNIAQPASITEYAQTKLSALEKFFKKSDLAKWNLRVKKEGKAGEVQAEAQIRTPRKNFGASAVGANAYEALDKLKSELSRKMRNFSDKSANKVKRGGQKIKEELRQEN